MLIFSGKLCCVSKVFVCTYFLFTSFLLFFTAVLLMRTKHGYAFVAVVPSLLSRAASIPHGGMCQWHQLQRTYFGTVVRLCTCICILWNSGLYFQGLLTSLCNSQAECVFSPSYPTCTCTISQAKPVHWLDVGLG